MSLTSLREYIREELARDLSIPIRAGTLDGPQARADMGSVHITSGGEDPDSVDIEQVELAVRVFLRQVVSRDPTIDPVDPAPLEDLVDRVYQSLRDKQADPGLQAAGAWFIRATGFEIDTEAYGVEVQVLAQRANPFLT